MGFNTNSALIKTSEGFRIGAGVTQKIFVDAHSCGYH